MKNIYKKGARKEYKICHDLRAEGYDIAQRSAGSHSPIDIFAINKTTKTIMFLQSKRVMSKTMDHIHQELKKQLEDEYDWLNGQWTVLFEVR